MSVFFEKCNPCVYEGNHHIFEEKNEKKTQPKQGRPF